MEGSAAAMNDEIVKSELVACRGGVTRWLYSLNLFKSPAVMLMLWRTFGLLTVGIWVLVVLLSLNKPDFLWAGFLSITRDFAAVLVIVLLFAALAYYVYALLLGGKLYVLLEMDEEGVRHTQVPKHYKKEQILASIEHIDTEAEEPVPASVGIMATAKTSMYCEFAKIKTVEIEPKRDRIKITQALGRNQVFVAPQDFEYVSRFILDRIPENAKVKNGKK